VTFRTARRTGELSTPQVDVVRRRLTGNKPDRDANRQTRRRECIAHTRKGGIKRGATANQRKKKAAQKAESAVPSRRKGNEDHTSQTKLPLERTTEVHNRKGQ